MTQMVLEKRNGGLFPVDPVSEDYLSKIKNGSQVLADVVKPRSPKQNRFVHAALAEVLKHTDQFRDVEDLKRFLKLRSRMYKPVVMPDGSIVFELPSIAFGSMDQIAFQRVWERWKWVILNEILPGVDEDELRSTILAEIS